MQYRPKPLWKHDKVQDDLFGNDTKNQNFTYKVVESRLNACNVRFGNVDLLVLGLRWKYISHLYLLWRQQARVGLQPTEKTNTEGVWEQVVVENISAQEE
jgi:hypothetical protein